MSRSCRDQRGAAALEMGLMLGLLCLVMLLLAPLPYAMLAKIKLERAAGQAARFATQTPDRARPGLPAGQRRPNATEVALEAVGSYRGPGTPTAVSVVTADATCPRNKAATVTMQTSVDLGPFAGFYQLVGITPTSSMTLSASATNCQE